MFKPSSNFLTDRYNATGGACFVDFIRYLCFMLVFAILSCLFLADLWSPDGKGLTFPLS